MVYVGSVFLFTTVIALTNGVGMWYPMFHILSGGLMFGAVFMLTDPVTNPTTITGRVIYSIGVAALTVVIRLQSSLPGGVVYAILIMNMVSPLIDKLTDAWSIYAVKKYSISIAATLAIGFLFTFIAGNNLEPKAITFPGEDGGVPIFTDMSQGTPEIVSSTEEGNIKTFEVSSPGYASAEGGKNNIIEVKINMDDKTVESVAVIEANDTPQLGTRIEEESFLAKFKGISADDETASVDAISGATISTISVTKAVGIALEEVK